MNRQVRHRPGLPLIGVDSSNVERGARSGRLAQALTLSDLNDLIRIRGDVGKESNGGR